MSSVVSSISAASVASATNIKRVLSFGRNRKPVQGDGRLRAASAAPESNHPTPAAATEPPVPVETPADSSTGKKVSRRAISFGRAKRGIREPSKKTEQESAAPMQTRRLRATTDSPSGVRGNFLIKRTTSWQRGHKQSARAIQASREVAERLLIEAAPLLLLAMKENERGPLIQVF